LPVVPMMVSHRVEGPAGCALWPERCGLAGVARGGQRPPAPIGSVSVRQRTVSPGQEQSSATGRSRRGVLASRYSHWGPDWL